MALSHAPRQMFTAEKRMLERGGSVMSSGLDRNRELVDELQSLINQEVTRAVDQAKSEIVQEIQKTLRGAVLSGAGNPDEVDKVQIQEEVTQLKNERDELLKKQDDLSLVKNEIHALTFSIEQTKREIAALYRAQGSGNRLEVMTYELDGIVQDTEIATQNIMDIAESIDDLGERLLALTEGSSVIQDLAEEITANTMKLFESCNFQDLTGQRITKVVNTLHLIDERLSKVVEIWGPEDFDTMEVEEDPTGLDGLNKIISQRSVEIEKVTQDEADQILSQDDLDALFG